MKKHQILSRAGRSMVEMLGVLAIIGVLSVGAIAGYQKAMRKYRLNKFATGYDQLLSNAMTLSEQLEATTISANSQSRTSILEKLNLIPEGFSYNEKTDRIYDMFGNAIVFYTRYAYGYSWGLGITLDNTEYTQDQCIHIIQIAQTYNDQLIWLLREEIFNSQVHDKFFLGEKDYAYNISCPGGSCPPKKGTLPSLTLSQIKSMCQPYTELGNSLSSFHYAW
jgi:type II secretory pathway pseudopilin PulG